MLACKSSLDINAIPRVRVPPSYLKFFPTYYNIDPLALAGRLEAYGIRGDSGVLENIQGSTADKRKTVTALLGASLSKSESVKIYL